MRRALTWQLILGTAIIGGWIVLGVAAPLLTNVDPPGPQHSAPSR
jgi:glycosyltransferase A (GT-A) superfamily protein (DUF2064 family)